MTKRHPAICAAIFVAASAVFTSMAAADDRVDCYGRAAPVDARVAACSRVIASGTVKGPNLANTYGWRGMAWSEKGQLDRAIADFDQALTLVPTSAAIHNERGFALLSKGDNEKALADFDAVIQFDPASAQAYLGHGTAQLNLRRYELAIKDFDEVLKLDPKSADAYNNRGYSYLISGQPDRALADLDEAIEINPRNSPPHSNRGLAYQDKGDLDRASRNSIRQLRSIRKRSSSTSIAVPCCGRRANSISRWRTTKPPSSSTRTRPIPIWAAASSGGRAAVSTGRSPSSTMRSARCAIHRCLCPARPNLRGQGDVEHARADYATALKTPPKYVFSVRSQELARTRLRAVEERRGAVARAGVATGQSRRIALIIGNGRYANVAALPNPPNDARAVASRLRDIGFDVTEGTDLDCRRHEAPVDQFLRSASGAQVALLFYAGHGMQIDGRNYLVPVDAKVGSAAELVASMIDVDTILRRPRRSGPHQHPHSRCLPRQSAGAESCGAGRREPLGQRRRRPRGALGARRRRNAGRRNADCICDRARAGGARRHRRQQPIFFGARAPRRDVRARSAADADPCARGCGRGHPQQAGAVVEFLAARRGFSRRCEVAASHILPNAIMVSRRASGRPA